MTLSLLPIRVAQTIIFSYPNHMLTNNVCVYSLDEKHFAPFAPLLVNIATKDSEKLYPSTSVNTLITIFLCFHIR